MENKRKKLFSEILSVLAVIIVLLAAMGYAKPMIVMSGSMEPAIKTGSVVFINTHEDIKDIKENDIITYKLLDAFITHRAVEANEHGIITKGDANRSKDLGIVTEENFYGKELLTIPYAGYILFYIKQNILPLGIAILAITAIAYFTRNFLKEERGRK